MAEPVERWSAGEKTLRYQVELSGEGRDVVVPPPHPNFRTRVYRVYRVTVRTRWLIGQEEGGKTFVTLHCHEVIGGRESHREGVLYLDQLQEVPSWLSRLETTASPRDVG